MTDEEKVKAYRTLLWDALADFEHVVAGLHDSVLKDLVRTYWIKMREIDAEEGK